MLKIENRSCHGNGDVLFVLGFYGPVNNEVMSTGQLIVALFLGKRLTSSKRGRPRQYLTTTVRFNSQNHNISVMFSRIPKDRTLEREDR